MKIKCLLVSLLILGLCSFVFSQTKENLDSTKVLLEKVKVGDNQSILDAGKSGDKTVVPYLKTLALKGSTWAQMALAKLGEQEYLNQILAEVDNEDVNTQNRAIEKLSYVGGKQAFRKLYQLLDDTGARGEEICKKQVEEFKRSHPEGGNCGFCCDVMILSRASEVVAVLSRTVENPPTRKSYGSDKDIKLWKEWFKKHKDLIE